MNNKNPHYNHTLNKLGIHGKMKMLVNNLDNFIIDHYYLKHDINNFEKFFNEEKKKMNSINSKFNKLLQSILNNEKKFKKIFDNFEKSNLKLVNLNLNQKDYLDKFIEFNKEINSFTMKHKEEFIQMQNSFYCYENKNIIDLSKIYKKQKVINDKDITKTHSIKKEEESNLKRKIIKEYVLNHEKNRQEIILGFLNYFSGIQLKMSFEILESNSKILNKIKLLENKKEMRINSEIKEYQDLLNLN